MLAFTKMAKYTYGQYFGYTLHTNSLASKSSTEYISSHSGPAGLVVEAQKSSFASLSGEMMRWRKNLDKPLNS